MPSKYKVPMHGIVALLEPTPDREGVAMLSATLIPRGRMHWDLISRTYRHNEELFVMLESEEGMGLIDPPDNTIMRRICDKKRGKKATILQSFKKT